MSKDSPPKTGMSKKRFRLILVGLLIVSLIVVTLVGAPLVAPITIGKLSYTKNTFVPVTSDPGFEQGEAYWSLFGGSSQSVIQIPSGGAESGSRSLYISDPGQSVSAWYNDTNKTLPLLINSSIVFGFDLLYEKAHIPQGSSDVWLTLFLSWRLQPNYTFPLTMVLGNYSIYQDATFDNISASAGIIMLRGVRSINSWNHYDLQLGTPRIAQLVKGYLLANSSTLYNLGDPLYVVGFRIAVDNADAYFDNVGLYNVVPGTVTTTLDKPTLLPALVTNVSISGIVVNYTTNYGATTDTVNFLMDLPLAFNATYQVVIQTGWGWKVTYNIQATDPSLPTWI